jgi:phosphoribosylanthranilate isomerase
MTRVKICGITREEDAQLAVQLGASAIGLVLWPGSPRYLGAQRARAIVETLPAHVTAVGVFVNQPLDDVRRAAEIAALGAVQLHGEESLEYAQALLQPVVKAVPVTSGFDAATLGAWPPEITVLLDAHDPVRRGGTGTTIDWTVAARAAARRPVLLSGGLTPENVRDAISQVRPFGIDLSSGVERAPGIKDPERLRALFDALTSTQHA